MMQKTQLPAFLESEITPLPAKDCRFQIIPVPYEASVSYGGGTAKAPQAILEASCQLEVWTGLSAPAEQGIFTWPFVDCTGGAKGVIDRIETAVYQAIYARADNVADDKPKNIAGAVCKGALSIPAILGGEHSVTFGSLKAMQKAYGHFGVIHFDAHADLRDTYHDSKYSHASVMHRAVADLGLDLFQVGVRSLCPEDIKVREKYEVKHCDARMLQCPRQWPAFGETTDPSCLSLPVPFVPEGFPSKVFLSFDLDAFDGSIMPATGTPEPGGLFWWDAINLLRICLHGRELIGFDVVELAPITGLHAPDYLAARLVYEIMGMVH